MAPCPLLETVVWHDLFLGRPRSRRYPKFNIRRDIHVLQAADAKTGKRLFQGRTGGVFSAAPIAGDGKVYFVSETGETIVLRASRDFEILARNKLDARFLASPVVSKRQIFLRSDDELICVGTPSDAETSGAR